MEQRFPFLHALQDFSLERGRSRSFLIFLALSFIFWLITKFSNQYTEVLPLEVSFNEYPAGVVPTSDTSSEIQLTLTASGFQLFFYKILGTKLVLDSRKGAFDDGIATLSLELSQQEIQDQLFGSLVINSIFPNTVSFEYTQLSNKRLAVALQNNLDLSAGFGISEPLQFIPDSINVIGASIILDALKEVYLNTEQKSKIKKSFTDQFKLVNPLSNQLEFSESTVTLKAIVDRFSETSLKVPIRLLNVPDSIALKLFPADVEVVFSASLSKIKTIDANDFVISSDFNNLRKEDLKMNLQLIQAPDLLQNIRWSPKEVEYLIRK